MLRTLIREYLSLIAENVNPSDPEFESIDAFVNYLVEEDREEFTPNELRILHTNTGRPTSEIKNELINLGFSMAKRAYSYKDAKSQLKNYAGAHMVGGTLRPKFDEKGEIER